MEPGLYEGIANEDYHADLTAVSKSMLDWVHQSPALLEWVQRAPVDHEAEKAVDLGNAFECLLLEPQRFEAEYIEAPDVDRRTSAGKATYKAFFDESEGKHVLSRDQMRQVKFMRESVLAHPMAKRIIEWDHIVQPSYWWIDDVSDVLCRCRPDLMCRDVPLVADVKVTQDERTLRRSLVDHRWHVQDSYYSDGTAHHYDERPPFLFIVAFSSRSAGRYPVRVVEFDETSKSAGALEYRADLETLIKCREVGFDHVEPLRLPSWKIAETESL